MEPTPVTPRSGCSTTAARRARQTAGAEGRDFLFPQQVQPELAPTGWEPRFLDYLYVSFTNAAAFSPTDVMPLSRWEKMLMLVQSAPGLLLAISVRSSKTA
jgi:hypothetical protein